VTLLLIDVLLNDSGVATVPWDWGAIVGHLVGQFIGGILVATILTLIMSAVVRAFTTPINRVWIANALSLIALTVLGAMGAADSGSLDFGKAFGTYALPQLAVFLVDLLRTRGAAVRGTAKPATALDRVEPTMGNPIEPERAVADATTATESDWHDRNLSLKTPPTGGMGKSSGNFIVQHWRGELRLGWSYWGIAFLGNIFALVAIVALNLIFTTEKGYDPAPLFWLNVLTWVVLTIIVIWQVVGTWRSATHHAERRMKLGKGTGWATAAKLALILGVLRFVGDFAQTGALQLGEYYDMAWRGDPRLPAYSMRVMRDGTEIEIAGGIKFGLVADFQRVLMASPRIRVVHLHSIGGRVGEAEKLRKEISSRGLITYVSARCESACTLAYAGGRERWISTSGGLGYHGPAFPGLTPEEKSAAVAGWKALYAGTGISAGLLDRGLAVPSTEMWRPTVQELVAARAVTNVSAGSEFAVSGYGTNPTADDLIAVFQKSLPVLAAIQSRLPGDYEKIKRVIFEGFTSGATETKVIADFRAQLLPLIESHKARADDLVLIEYARVMIDQYQTLGRSNPTLCYQYAAFGSKVSLSNAIPAAITQREIALQERVILTSAERPPIPESVTNALLTRVQQAMIRRFGAARMAMFQLEQVEPSQHADYCAITGAFYQEIVGMRPVEAGAILRAIHAR
jgi:hypothetical protein